MKESYQGIKLSEREELIKVLVQKQVANNPGLIFFAGTSGSDHRGEATPFSDIEILLITKDEEVNPFYTVCSNCAISVDVVSRSRLFDICAEPDLQWPYYFGVIKSMSVLYGDEAERIKLVKLFTQTAPEKTMSCLQSHFPKLVFESFGRILSCECRQNAENLQSSIIEMLTEMNLALCLLNHDCVFHDYLAGIRDAAAFSLLPKDYIALAEKLWFCNDLKIAAELAKELMDNYLALMDQHIIIPKLDLCQLKLKRK